MNWPRSIDWWDISAHTAVAILFAIGLGIAANAGLAHGGFWGWALVVLAVAGNAANSLFWILRERLQHRDDDKTPKWGGGQSFLEWIVPLGAAWAVFIGVVTW